jgi:hypothetical protein
MIKSIINFKKVFGFAFTVQFIVASHAFAEDNLKDFITENGKCTLTQKAELTDQAPGFSNYSYTLKETAIYKRRGLSPTSGTSLKPLTRVNCLARSETGKNLMLVTSAKANELLCGWVETDNLLEASGSGSVLMESGLEPCGIIEAITIREFCSKMKNLDEIVAGCTQNSVGRSVIKTKFITDNTSSRDYEGKRLVTKEKIDLFSSPQSMEKIGNVKIFTILEVFDVARNESSENVRLLVGIKGTDLKGWINYNSGSIWYSNLSAFFSSVGKKDVFQSEIGVQNNQELAVRPKNLQSLLNGAHEFPRFPVLYDYRKKTKFTPKKLMPHLEIAFIGRFCEGGDGSLCSESSRSNNSVSLKSADIMFLIDGTKSMEKYFSLVSKAVSKFTEEYIDDPNYRFGVATYGDFKVASKTKTTDKMDFKIINPLKANFGDAFSRLSETKLFIKDVRKDKEEPTNAAIYNTVNATLWKENRLRFIIHIADHGDRVNPSKIMLDKLKAEKIFYIPIAVRGEGIIAASDKFVRQSQEIYKKHITANGSPMALKPSVTYKQNIPEFEAISRALVAALSLGTDAQADIYGDNNQENADDLGYAELTISARELFSTDSTNETLETIAAKGFIETVEIGQKEKNWDYFVALNTNELLSLERGMEKVCRTIGGSNDIKVIEESLRSMIEALTGDRLSEEELRIYVQDRASIPLVTQTLLGEGLFKFMKEYTNPNKISDYKKSFCRGYELTKLMQQDLKLPAPIEGGSLIWMEDQYETKDEVEHNWLYKDFFERGYYYVPLTYLPGWKQ